MLDMDSFESDNLSKTIQINLTFYGIAIVINFALLL